MKPYKIIFLCFLIYGCNNYQNDSLTGEIRSLEINHVIKKRNGCRKTILSLDILLINYKSYDIELDKLPKYNPCKNLEKSSDLQLVNLGESLRFNGFPLSKKDSINLSLKNSKKDNVIKTKDSLGVNTVIEIPASYGSLANIDSIFKKFYNYDFQVYFKDEKVIFDKSIDFEVRYLLDDRRIEQTSKDFTFEIVPTRKEGEDINQSNRKQ